MLTKFHSPKTKQELISALQQAPIKTVTVYEGDALKRIPSKEDLQRNQMTVIVLK